jgi:hypothetical protein
MVSEIPLFQNSRYPASWPKCSTRWPTVAVALPRRLAVSGPTIVWNAEIGSGGALGISGQFSTWTYRPRLVEMGLIGLGHKLPSVRQWRAHRRRDRGFGVLVSAAVARESATRTRSRGRFGPFSFVRPSHEPCETGRGHASWGGMPELPDIAAYIAALEPRVMGVPLEGVRLVSPFLLRTTTPALSEAAGRTVRELRRVGKRIAIGLDGDLWLVLHLEACPRGPQGAPEPGGFRFPAGLAHAHRGRQQAEGIAPRGGRRARPARNGPGRHRRSHGRSGMLPRRADP